jgi:hypothetical protein
MSLYILASHDICCKGQEAPTIQVFRSINLHNQTICHYNSFVQTKHQLRPALRNDHDSFTKTLFDYDLTVAAFFLGCY